ncbi:DedA family protein [Candidatus Peregrinibacteria bacterium]|nr:DedA family protein [Candidatus Peregrinibacteria bacterium]
MFFSLEQIIDLLETYKYVLLFPLAVIEGPMVTVLAAFLASLGYFNTYYVYGLVVLGDIVGDALYYALGKWGGRKFINRWGKYIGIQTERMGRLEQHFAHHSRKTLIIGKLTQTGAITLVLAGIVKMPFLEFLIFNLIPTVPKSLLLVYIGYYFGKIYATVNDYIAKISIVLIILGIILLWRLFFQRKK